jgi:hypothetical protein
VLDKATAKLGASAKGLQAGATSKADMLRVREGSLYLSTGGGWSPNTSDALQSLAAWPDIQLVAATDANPQGEAFANRLRELAKIVGCGWLRLRPPAEDWNGVLKQKAEETRERRKERFGMPHSRRPRQGMLRPAVLALDPAGHDAGGLGSVTKD